MNTIAGFQAIQFEKAWSVQDRLKVQKCFSEIARACCSFHSEGVNARTSLESKNKKSCLENLSIHPNASFFDEWNLDSAFILCSVYENFESELLQNLHLGISELLEENEFKFLV